VSNKIKAVLIFPIVYLCLSGLLYFFIPQYTRIYLPFVKNTLDVIYPDYFKFHSIKPGNHGKTLYYKVTFEGEAMKNNKLARAELTYKSSCQVVFIVIYPVLIFSLLICWPDIPLKIRIIAAICAVQILFFMTLLDLALTIMHSLELKLDFNNTMQDFRKFIILFFNNGGRQFLAVIITWFSVNITRWGFVRT